MQRILVTGALGQIGSELTHALRQRYGSDLVVASDLRMVPPQSTGRARTIRARRLHAAAADSRGGAPLRGRHDLSPRRAAFGGGGGEAARRLEPQHGRPLQRAGGRAPVSLPGVLPELDRRVRPVDAARSHAAGHDPAADHDVRRHQGLRRAAVRLLLVALRRRHARAAPARPDLLRRAARRRHDGLRGRHFPPGAALRALHLLPRRGDAARHDVHAGRHPRHGRADGRRRSAPRTPQRLQRHRDEHHACRTRRRDPQAHSGFRHRLSRRSDAPVDRGFLAALGRRQRRARGMGLVAQVRSRGDDRGHARAAAREDRSRQREVERRQRGGHADRRTEQGACAAARRA